MTAEFNAAVYSALGRDTNVFGICGVVPLSPAMKERFPRNRSRTPSRKYAIRYFRGENKFAATESAVRIFEIFNGRRFWRRSKNFKNDDPGRNGPGDSRGRWWSWNSATTSAAEWRDDRNIVRDFRKRWKEKNCVSLATEIIILAENNSQFRMHMQRRRCSGNLIVKRQ